MKEHHKDYISGYLYISPFFIIFGIFGLYPILFNFYLAFQKWNGLTEMSFVGVRNFIVVFQDPIFWKSVYNTIIMGLMGTAPQVIVGIILAYLLNLSFLKWRNVFRVSVFLPYVTSLVAVAIIFSVIFSNAEAGLVNWLLGLFGQEETINFKTSEWGVKIAISTMVFWRWLGYNTIIYLAGMQSIPGELYQAAKIDGANTRQQIMYITIPMIRPFVVLTVFISTVGALQLFVEPQLFTTQGALYHPASITIVQYLYRDAFDSNSFGTASATAVVLFFMIVILAGLNVFAANRFGRNKRR